MRETEFYSVAERKHVTCKKKDICVKMYPNKKMKGGYAPALVSISPNTGYKLTKWVAHDKVDELIEKYGECE